MGHFCQVLRRNRSSRACKRKWGKSNVGCRRKVARAVILRSQIRMMNVTWCRRRMSRSRRMIQACWIDPCNTTSKLDLTIWRNRKDWSSRHNKSIKFPRVGVGSSFPGRPLIRITSTSKVLETLWKNRSQLLLTRWLHLIMTTEVRLLVATPRRKLLLRIDPQ